MRKVAAIAIVTLLYLPAAAQAELVVNISKAQQQLSVVVNGETAYRWPVSTGRPRYPTPAGKFRPIRLEKKWYSRKYNMTPMPWSVFFYKGYAVHGTLETKRLGRAVSHGCVRLLPANASILFALVREHGFKATQFVVLNGPLPQGSAPKPPVPRPPSDAPSGMASLPPEGPQSHLTLAAHRHAPEPAEQAPPQAPVQQSEPAKELAPQAAAPLEAAKTTQLALRHDAAANDAANVTDNHAASDQPAQQEAPMATPAKSEPAEPEAATPLAVTPDPAKPEAVEPVAVTPDAAKPKTAKAEPAKPLAARSGKNLAKPRPRVRVATTDYSVSVGSEAQVLRERAAWLRSIDRKYGITH